MQRIVVAVIFCPFGLLSRRVNDANRNEGGVCIYRHTLLPFFVNVWKESGLLIDRIRDSAEGYNVLSCLTLYAPCIILQYVYEPTRYTTFL